MYDGRLGRRWNVDPEYKHYLSNYSTLGNNPIQNLDPNGDDDWNVKDGKSTLVCEDGLDVFVNNKNIENTDFGDNINPLAQMASHYYNKGSNLSVDVIFPAISKNIRDKNSFSRFQSFFEKLPRMYFYEHVIASSEPNRKQYGGYQNWLGNSLPAVDFAMHVVRWRDEGLRNKTNTSNEMEHHVGTFLMLEYYGLGGFAIVQGNEAFNLNLDYSTGGLNRVFNALTNYEGNAFEWKDIQNNFKGAEHYLKYLYKKKLNGAVNWYEKNFGR